jgi:hypothetical protein
MFGSPVVKHPVYRVYIVYYSEHVQKVKLIQRRYFLVFLYIMQNVRSLG